MSKGIASMEQKQCPVTGELWDTGDLLVAKNTRQKLDMHTVTGFAFSPEVQKNLDNGYVALIEIDEEATNKGLKPGQAPGMLDAVRTGRLCYLKRELCDELFNVGVKEFNFISQDVYEMLIKNTEEENVDTTEEKETPRDGES